MHTDSPAAPSSTHVKVLIFSTFIAGLCSIVYELLIATTGSYFLGDSIRQFSLVIGFYMAFMGVGSYLSRLIPDRLLLQAFVLFEILLGLAGGLSVPLLYFSFAYLEFFQGALLLATSLVGVLIGLEIPLLSRLMSHNFPLKDNISNILSLDYLGALIATLLFPFLLLPWMGVFKTSLIFGLINMSIGFTIIYFFADTLKTTLKRALFFYSVTALSLLVLTFVFSKSLLAVWTQELYKDRVVFAKETPYQQVVITKYKEDVRLFLNGNLQFSAIDEYRYHEALVHIPMLGKNYKNVLVLGGGDGLAVRELLKYPALETLTLVDLDPIITELAKSNPHLIKANHNALASDKITIIHQDAFVFLRENTELFDLIIIDLPDPNNTSLARLYSREFYWSIYAKLAPSGRMVTQATSPYYANDAFWSIAASIRTAGFKTVMPYHVNIPSFGEWGFVMASKEDDRLIVNELPDFLRTRYLDKHNIERAFVFGKDLQAKSQAPSTLDSPKVLDYYLSSWKYWR